MTGFNEQPKQTLTADTKAGDVSIVERMEALHGLVKKGRKPEEEHDYVKEALRIVSAMYAGIELPKTMEPQSVEFPPDVTITLKGTPKISADGKSFSVVFDDQGFNKYLIVSDQQEKQIKNKREISEIQTEAGSVYQVNNDHGGFVLYDEKENAIFDTEKSAMKNSKNQITADGVSFWNKEPKAMGFFSFQTRQIYLYTVDVDSAQVLAGKTVLIYKNINDKDKKQAVRINERVFEKKYSEIHKVFEHEGKISFIASQQDRWGRKILWVNEDGGETVLHAEHRLGFDGKPDYASVHVEVKEHYIFVGVRQIDERGYTSMDKYQDQASYSLSGNKLADIRTPTYLGTRHGKDVFGVYPFGVTATKTKVIDQDNRRITTGNFVMDKNKSAQVGEDIFVTRKIKEHGQDRYEVVSLSGEVVPRVFKKIYKLECLAGKLLIIDEDINSIGVSEFRYYNDQGELLLKKVNEGSLYLEYLGGMVFVSKKKNDKFLMVDDHGQVILDDLPFEPHEFKAINGRVYAFNNLDSIRKGIDVFDIKNKKYNVFSAVKPESDDEVLFVARTAEHLSVRTWWAYDHDMNQFGVPYDDVYDTRINNGKVWVLGKRDNQIVYEPAGGV